MWHELNSQNDIDNFMKETAGFHDSCIVELNYKSGSFVKEDGAMCLATEPYMYITFHSQMAKFPAFEMELGMLDRFAINLNLGYTLEIYNATFEKRDDGFYWYSDENGRYHIENGHENVNYWFRCQTIRWREIPLVNQSDGSSTNGKKGE
jgi:hypothetical protein lmonocytFSL_02678